MILLLYNRMYCVPFGTLVAATCGRNVFFPLQSRDFQSPTLHPACAPVHAGLRVFGAGVGSGGRAPGEGGWAAVLTASR